MATFGKFETTIVPSEFGLEFEVDTPVRFSFQDQAETGEVVKQLRNSAIIKIKETYKVIKLFISSTIIIIYWEF